MIETAQALKDAKWALFQSKREVKQILEQYQELESRQDESEEAERSLALVSEQLSQLEKRNTASKERIDSLRQEKHRLKTELRERNIRLEELKSAAEYIDQLRTLTYYTRTRFDYERSLIRLTPEQNDVVERINESHDFLVKGAAGTGKTLVLLETLRRILERRLANPELDGGTGGPIILVTYNKTLERYNHYLTSLMEMGEDLEIRTVDSLIFEAFRKRFPGYRIDFNTGKSFCKEASGAGGLTHSELHLEIENLLLGGGVTEKEYCEDVLPRTGLKKRLDTSTRREIWGLRDEYISVQKAAKAVSRNHARLMLLESFIEKPEDDLYDHIFVDESQDLFPVDLSVLKAITRKSLLMAGDKDQTLYGFSSPYARADIRLSGYSRTVKTNFRNTLPIHELAERIRNGSDSSDEDSCPAAFRNGPQPEIVKAEKTEELYGLLVKILTMLTDGIGYEMENMTVVVPSKVILKKIDGIFKQNGFLTADIHSNTFSFTDTPGIRLSTIHSAKGLDFPVVLAFVPTLFGAGGLDEASSEKQLRNQLYVALTRAMEYLVVFTKDGADGILGEL